jgi:hypothetical protein
LIDIALPIRRWKDNYTWIAFFGKAIDTIVIVFIEHPELKLFNKLSPFFSDLPAIHV